MHKENRKDRWLFFLLNFFAPFAWRVSGIIAWGSTCNNFFVRKIVFFAKQNITINKKQNDKQTQTLQTKKNTTTQYTHTHTNSENLNYIRLSCSNNTRRAQTKINKHKKTQWPPRDFQLCNEKIRNFFFATNISPQRAQLNLWVQHGNKSVL